MPIEQVAPECARLVDLDQEVEWLASGFGADGSALGLPWWPAEGPVWWQEGGYLLFSDIGQSKRLKWAPGEGVTLVATPTNEANGMTRDPQGRLIVCEHAAQRVTRLEPDGCITVVADRYQGKRLNRPNDIVVKSDGSIYFTDPFRPTYPNLELGFAGVYRVSPDLQTVTLLVDDYVGPNGLCFSPSERTLYINDSRVGLIKAFDVVDDGTIANGRLFCVLKDERPGVPDGMKVDLDGNLYCTGPGGVWIIDPSGKHLGTIALREGKRATNIGWGGGDWKTLFITTFHELARIRMKISGVPVPRQI